MKILYNTTTQQILPYPRNDDQPIIGLSPELVALTKIETPLPPYNSETHGISGSNYIVDLEREQYRQEWTITELPSPSPPPSLPDYSGFNGYMLIDPLFKSYRDTVRALDGDLNGALFDAYSLIDTKGIGAFSQVWARWTELSNITPEDKETIAVIAEEFNLPADFIAVIRK